MAIYSEFYNKMVIFRSFLLTFTRPGNFIPMAVAWSPYSNP